jgi:hypothetical protein
MDMTRTSHKIITAPRAIICTEQPLTGFDATMPTDGFCLAMVYPQPLDTCLLVDSLQRTLDQKPYFAGRVFGMGSTLPLVIPNNEGALLSISEFAGCIPSFDIENPLKPMLGRFAHCIHGIGFDHHTPLLQIKLTNFSDGCILCVTASQILCDTTAMTGFMQDWSANATKRPIARPAPCDRRDVQQMAIGDSHSQSHSRVLAAAQHIRNDCDDIDAATYRLSGSTIAQLHDSYREAENGISRQDIIAAFIYLLLIRCNDTARSTPALGVICDVRGKLELSPSYLGNATCLRFLDPDAPQLKAANIRTIAHGVRKLREDLTATGIRQDLAFWQHRIADGTAARFIPLATHLALEGGIVIHDMSHFDIYALNFGSGPPRWIDIPARQSPAQAPRSVLMLPAPPDDGGVDLHVTLPSAEMAMLRVLMTGVHAEPACQRQG